MDKQTMDNKIVIYGIANCDTVKKAREWFGARGVPVTWHDFKKHGLSPSAIDAWLRKVKWEDLLNRRGTTWRNLSDAAKASVVDAASAKALMLIQPSIIRRPIVEWDAGVVTTGFSDETFAKHLD